jgi:hypothetical protein
MKTIYEKDFAKLKPTLSDEEIATIVALKILGPGNYVKGRGILDNDFYLITETESDETYTLSKGC